MIIYGSLPRLQYQGMIVP